MKVKGPLVIVKHGVNFKSESVARLVETRDETVIIKWQDANYEEEVPLEAMRLLGTDAKRSSRRSASISRRITAGGKEGASDENPPEEADDSSPVADDGLAHGNVVAAPEKKSCPCDDDGKEAICGNSDDDELHCDDGNRSSHCEHSSGDDEPISSLKDKTNELRAMKRKKYVVDDDEDNFVAIAAGSKWGSSVSTTAACSWSSVSQESGAAKPWSGSSTEFSNATSKGKSLKESRRDNRPAWMTKGGNETAKVRLFLRFISSCAANYCFMAHTHFIRRSAIRPLHRSRGLQSCHPLVGIRSK